MGGRFKALFSESFAVFVELEWRGAVFPAYVAIVTEFFDQFESPRRWYMILVSAFIFFLLIDFLSFGKKINYTNLSGVLRCVFISVTCESDFCFH